MKFLKKQKVLFTSILVALFSPSTHAVLVNSPTQVTAKVGNTANFNGSNAGVGYIYRWTTKECKKILFVTTCSTQNHSRNEIQSSSTKYRWDFGDGNSVNGVVSTGNAFYNIGNDQLVRSLPNVSHTYSQPGIYDATLTVTDSSGQKNTKTTSVTITPSQLQTNNVDIANADNCTIKTVASLSSWNNPRAWDLNRIPNANDVVCIRPTHTMLLPEHGKIEVSGLSISAGANLETPKNRLSTTPNHVIVNAGVIHNRGEIRTKSGISGAIIGNNYENATSAGSVSIFAGKFINDTSGIILARAGGDDIPYPYFETGSGVINAIGGNGGSINIFSDQFTNNGSFRAGNGGKADLFESWSQFVYGNAFAGNGGSIFVSTSNMAQSGTGGNSRFQVGCGGDAEAIGSWTQKALGKNGSWVFSTSVEANFFGKLFDVVGGQGGNLAINLSTLKGFVRGCPGRTTNHVEVYPTEYIRFDPTILTVDESTHLVNANFIYIFAGDDAQVDLRKLSPSAVQAYKTITLAVGKNGVIDLRGLNSVVFQAAEKVEIFADQVLLDEGVQLSNLINSPEIQVKPSKLLHFVDLQYPQQIKGDAGAVVPVTLTVLNNGSSKDTYKVEVSDSLGWLEFPIPTDIEINSLRRSDIDFNVRIPNSGYDKNIIQVKITSQSDPSVQILANIQASLYHSELITPRNGKKADLSIVLDGHLRMGEKLNEVADALEKVLIAKGYTPPTDQQLINWLNQFSSTPPSQAAYLDFLKQLQPEGSSKLSPPVIELITFTDTVSTRVVTDNLGDVIGRIRSLAVSEQDTCALASVEAVEYAANNLNQNGQLFLAVASTPRKSLDAAISRLQQLGVKTHVLLANGCEQSTDSINAYQALSQKTGGIFRTVTGDEQSDTTTLENLVSQSVTHQGVCRLYGVNDGGMNNSQFFVIDPQNLELTLLGEEHREYDIESIAVNPATGRIYGASGDAPFNDKPKGYLYEITSAGNLIPIGATGFREVGDLTFANGQLYGHATAHEQGIVKIDINTGKATLVKSVRTKLAGFTSVKKADDSLFYGVTGQQLWKFNLNSDEANLLCDNLPSRVEALETVGDIVLFGTHLDTSFQLVAFNPATCQVVVDKSYQLPAIDDVEGLAWDHSTCK